MTGSRIEVEIEVEIEDRGRESRSRSRIEDRGRGGWGRPGADWAALAVVTCAVVLAGLGAGAVEAQEGDGPTGRELAGLPALNFDADEGFGYGVVLELYDYGDGRRPYSYTVQPQVFLTTGGRRDLILFFDAPHLLPGEWRIDAYLATEKQIATPFYGLGNASAYDRELETDENPYYYRYGRTVRQLRVNLQRPLAAPRFRVLLGFGVSHTTLAPVPKDSGTTYLAEQVAVGAQTAPEGWWNYVRAGLIRDTRDREVGPTRGSWSELLVQHTDELLGSESSYTRLTATDRRYLAIARRLVVANRFLVQQVTGDAPFHELSYLQSSFKPQEGLGGAKSVRGLPRNRFVGEGVFLWNLELRWRAADWTMVGRPFHSVLSVFIDSGRVWGTRAPALRLEPLHHGYGAGVRVGMGESFVVAVDAGTSADAGLGLYIGLGYLY